MASMAEKHDDPALALRGALDAIEALQAEVGRLRAKDDIRDLIVSYARACDRGNDPVLLRPLFTDDASWECKGFGRYEGGDLVARFLKAIAGERIWWSLHNMIAPQIMLDASGQKASAFWYLWEAATLPNEHSGEAEAYWIAGTYDAEIRKVDGRWLFRAVELKLDMASPVSEAWVRKRFPDGTVRQPYFLRMTAGRYKWCACGKSKTAPFCDGSHEGGRIDPVAFEVANDGLRVLCGCRMSRNKPFCDGAHLKLKL